MYLIIDGFEFNEYDQLLKCVDYINGDGDVYLRWQNWRNNWFGVRKFGPFEFKLGDELGTGMPVESVRLIKMRTL